MRLDDSVRKKIAQKLGRPVPPPSDESFWELLEELRATRPELAAELEENVIFDDLGDPEREAQRADARAVAFRMAYRKLFYRFDEVRQRWHLHRGKLLGWGVGLFMAFFVPAFYYRPTPQTVAVSAGSGGSMSGGAVAEALELPKAPKLPRPEPLIIEQPRESEPAPAPLVAQPTAPVVPLIQPQVPATSEPGSLRAYSKEDAAAGTEVQGLDAYRRDGQAADTPQAGSSDPFADPSSTVQTAGLSAYREPQPEAQTQPQGLSAYSREAAPSTLRTLADPSTGEPSAQPAAPTDPLQGDSGWQPSGGSSLQEPQYAQVSAPGSSAADPFSAPVATEGAPTETEPAEDGMYNAGDTVDGTLAVGLIALGNEPMPVIVRGRDGSVWQGQAALNASGRVDITFSTAAGESGSQNLEAIALAEDGYVGVPATIKETTPALTWHVARYAVRASSSKD